MSNRWLLVETFGGRPGPSLIAVGSTPKKMVPLASVLGRGHNLELVTAAVAQVHRSEAPTEIESDDHHHRVIAHPLMAFTGHVHGAFVWVGGLDTEPPSRDLAGASTSRPTPSADPASCLIFTASSLSTARPSGRRLRHSNGSSPTRMPAQR